MTPIGLAHVTLLSVTPPDLVSTAAEAGYDFVGIRVQTAKPREQPYPMKPGSQMSRETLRRLDDTGLKVYDVESVVLGPSAGPDDWRPALEAGAVLGARTISVAGIDPDRRRLTHALAALTADAKAVGIRPALEPISYHPVSTVTGAAELLAQVPGTAILLDALHIQRSGSTIDDVRALDPALLSCLQLCDGPLRAPNHLDLPYGMIAKGSMPQVEARVQRQLVGDGELPLADLLSATPEGTPLSVEVPHAKLQAKLTPLKFAHRNLECVLALLGRMGAHALQPEHA